MLCLGSCFWLCLLEKSDRRALVLDLALCKVGLVCTSVMKSRLFAGFQRNNCMHACKFENDVRGVKTNGNI